MKVSIITPVYNTTDIIKETYQSIADQTLQDFEWILVNDGSTNSETKLLLDQLQQADKRIRVITHPENKGLPATRNTGIRNSTAPFLFFIDADDLIAPTFLEKAWLVLTLHKAFAFVNSYVIGFGAQQYQWTGGFHQHEVFIEQNRNTSCFMARKEVFEAVLFDESMKEGCEDWDFWLHAALKGHWGYTIPEYLFYYRRSANNKWTALQGKQSLKAIGDRLRAKYHPGLKKNGFSKPAMAAYNFGATTPSLTTDTFVLPDKKNHIFCLFPWLEIGGADLYNLALLEGLKQKGWQITIVTTKQSEHPLLDRFKSVSEDIFHLANLGPESTFASTIAYLINTRHPSVVFLSNSMNGYYLLPLLKQQFPGLPVVDYVHCEDPGWYNGGYPYFSALFTHFLDKTFVTSQNLKDWCVAKGANPDKVDVCYINIDEKAVKRDDVIRKKVRDQLQLPDNKVLILYVARLTEQKQPLVMVKTLSLLKKNGFVFHCVIIGDGPDKDLMLRSIRLKNLSHDISFLGSQPHETVMEYMNAADIFFLPSLYEGIALSIFEAMSKGLVVVGAITGGQQELVTPNCGFLIQKDLADKEAEQYAHLLAQLIRDPALMRTMGSNSRGRIEKLFQLDSMIGSMHAKLATIKPSKRTGMDLNATYEIVLNHMLHNEAENQVFKKQTGSGAFKLFMKLNKPYLKARKLFYKLINR